MEEDPLLVCRKTGKTGEDSNGDNSQHYLLLTVRHICNFAVLCSVFRHFAASLASMKGTSCCVIECVRCHAKKNKIKNYATDKVKKL